MLVLQTVYSYRLITLALLAGRAGLLPLVPWLIEGILLLDGLMASSLFAI